MSADLSFEQLRELIYPIGTEDRCCFVCGQSSTNPSLLETHPHRFQARTYGRILTCLRFNTNMWRQHICGEFVHRDVFPGWPKLPPSIHPADRWRDDYDGPIFTSRRPLAPDAYGVDGTEPLV